MVRKSDLVSGMADSAAHRIAEDASSWKEYLNTASEKPGTGRKIEREAAV